MRSPKSPARKKARVWKAWTCFNQNGEPCVELVRSTRKRTEDATAMLVGRSWFGLRGIGNTVRRVEIREILPAPVPPRSRKSKGGGK